MSGRGGARPGAGRKKGSVSKGTRLRIDVAARALAEGRTPLEIMLEAMRQKYAAEGAVAAVPFAKEAAPYVHPKLAAVQATVEDRTSYEGALRKLYDLDGRRQGGDEGSDKTEAAGRRS